MRDNLTWMLALLVLLATGALGIVDGVSDLPAAAPGLQTAVTVGVLAYGVLGLGAALALVLRHRAATWLAALWGAVVTYVAAAAPIAYGGPEVSAESAVMGAVVTAIIAAAVVWVARARTRSSAAPSAAPPSGGAVA